MARERSVRTGILLLDKPLGVSSNAALQRVRRLMGAAKAGHVGSLDPLATGMLPICLEEATKIAGDILAARKCYRFTVRLGVRTATGDAEGPVIATAAVPQLARAQIECVLGGFVGPQVQIPPMYSALKQGGQPLYRLARAGIEVERAARPIDVSSLGLLSFEDAALSLEVICSKGTYVRTLAEDIARGLGTCGYVTRLHRVYVEPFVARAMYTLEKIAALRAAGDWPAVLPADLAVQHLAAVCLDPAAAERLVHGQTIAAVAPTASGRVRLYDDAARFLGIGETDGQGHVRPRRLFVLSPSHHHR
jgi:tRNA pseudouridine55 synthase